MRVGVELVGGGFGDDVHAGKAGLAVFAVALTESAGSIEDDVGVVDSPSVVEAQFDAANEAGFFQVGGDHEIAEDVFAGGLGGEGGGHFDNQIGWSHLPLGRDDGRGGQVGGISFLRSCLDP